MGKSKDSVGSYTRSSPAGCDALRLVSGRNRPLTRIHPDTHPVGRVRG